MELFPAEVLHNVSQGMMGEVSYRATVQQHIVLEALYSPVKHCTLFWYYVLFIMQDILFCSGLKDDSDQSGNA